MVKQEVNICDVCKGRVADKKCDLCEKDVCHSCKGYKSIRIGNVQIATIITCRNCYSLNRKMIENPESFKNEELIKSVKTPLLNHLKKIAILGNLDKKGEEETHTLMGNVRAG